MRAPPCCLPYARSTAKSCHEPAGPGRPAQSPTCLLPACLPAGSARQCANSSAACPGSAPGHAADRGSPPRVLTGAGARAAGSAAPGTAPAMADELAGYTSCRDLSPGLMQMHWKARRPGPFVCFYYYFGGRRNAGPAAALPQNLQRLLQSQAAGGLRMPSHATATAAPPGRPCHACMSICSCGSSRRCSAKPGDQQQAP